MVLGIRNIGRDDKQVLGFREVKDYQSNVVEGDINEFFKIEGEWIVFKGCRTNHDSYGMDSGCGRWRYIKGGLKFKLVDGGLKCSTSDDWGFAETGVYHLGSYCCTGGFARGFKEGYDKNYGVDVFCRELIEFICHRNYDDVGRGRRSDAVLRWKNDEVATYMWGSGSREVVDV